METSPKKQLKRDKFGNYLQPEYPSEWTEEQIEEANSEDERSNTGFHPEKDLQHALDSYNTCKKLLLLLTGEPHAIASVSMSNGQESVGSGWQVMPDNIDGEYNKFFDWYCWKRSFHQDFEDIFECVAMYLFYYEYWKSEGKPEAYQEKQ